MIYNRSARTINETLLQRLTAVSFLEYAHAPSCIECLYVEDSLGLNGRRTHYFWFASC